MEAQGFRHRRVEPRTPWRFRARVHILDLDAWTSAPGPEPRRTDARIPHPPPGSPMTGSSSPRAASQPPASEGPEDVRLLLEEIQLLLAQKRTSLSVLRTGIAVLALPLSVTSLLIATSELYGVGDVLPLLVPVLLVCAGLVLLAAYLVAGSLQRIHVLDHRIEALRGRSAILSDLVPPGHGSGEGTSNRRGLAQE